MTGPSLHDEARCDRVNDLRLIYDERSPGVLTWSCVYHMPRLTPAVIQRGPYNKVWDISGGCVLLRTKLHDSAWAALENLSRMVMLEEQRRSHA